MATRHLYRMSGGQPLYYTNDEETTLYVHGSGKRLFYIKDGTVFALDGKAAYWIKDKYLYQHGRGGEAALYFAD